MFNTINKLSNNITSCFITHFTLESLICCINNNQSMIWIIFTICPRYNFLNILWLSILSSIFRHFNLYSFFSFIK